MLRQKSFAKLPSIFNIFFKAYKKKSCIRLRLSNKDVLDTGLFLLSLVDKKMLNTLA